MGALLLPNAKFSSLTKHGLLVPSVADQDVLLLKFVSVEVKSFADLGEGGVRINVGKGSSVLKLEMSSIFYHFSIKNWWKRQN